MQETTPITPDYFSVEFIEQTRKLFEPLAERTLSNEECAEIARQTIEMEFYLQELRRKYANN
jgi:hypothetical protein